MSFDFYHFFLQGIEDDNTGKTRVLLPTYKFTMKISHSSGQMCHFDGSYGLCLGHGLFFVRNCDGFFIWQPHSFAQERAELFDCFGMRFFFGGKCSWSKQSTLDISLERVVGRTSANGLEVMGFIQLYEAITVHAFAIEHVRYPAITLFVNWNSCSLFEVLTRKYFLTTQPFQHSSTERFVDNSHFQQDGSLLVLMWL